MRRVAHIMGMPVSIDVPDVKEPGVFEQVFALLRGIDARFSTYKPESEVSRYRAGRLSEVALSDELRAVMRACRDWEARTDGFFSAYFAGQGQEHFDPTGYVKGWAIARAGQLLEQVGVHTYMINIAGDILAHSSGGHEWRIVLQHPRQHSAAMGMITARHIAVATSGGYERGKHIFDPHSGKPAHGVLSATVIGPDVVAADVLATAVCAMGMSAGAAFIESQAGYEALLVDQALRAVATTGFSTRSVL